MARIPLVRLRDLSGVDTLTKAASAH